MVVWVSSAFLKQVGRVGRGLNDGIGQAVVLAHLGGQGLHGRHQGAHVVHVLGGLAEAHVGVGEGEGLLQPQLLGGQRVAHRLGRERFGGAGHHLAGLVLGRGAAGGRVILGRLLGLDGRYQLRPVGFGGLQGREIGELLGELGHGQAHALAAFE